jgi:hypothetical protein
VALIIPTIGELNILIAVVTYLVSSKIKLFKSNTVITPDTVLADLTEADYTGYVAQTVTAWGTPVLNGDGKAETIAPSHTFAPTSPTTVPNIVYGYWVEDTAGNLLWAENFAEPKALNGPTDGFVLLGVFTFASEVIA